MEAEKKQVLNSEQQDAVHCVQNTVVAAGAGSGKTLVLARRYSWLVTERKIRVPEILTLTFTKKAAAQMYRRIHRELTECAKADTGEKGKLARQALDEFAQARIQTLDSYCTSIVKQAANRYGISPDFSTDKDRCDRLALDESLPFLVANRGHPAMQRLYLQKSPVYIAKNVFAAALSNYTHIDSLRADPKNDIKNQFALICGEWKKQSRAIREKLDGLCEAYRENEKGHPDLAPILKQYNDGLVVFPCEKELEAFLGQLIEVPHKAAVDWAEAQPMHKAMLDFFAFLALLQNLDMRRGPRKDNHVKEMLKEFHKVSFGEVSALIVFCLQAGLIYSVLMLLSELQHRYIVRKRAEGILTFTDVARLARRILLEQHDIRHSEKEAFKAIMIDEFQDNNGLQKDLLFFLAEKPEVARDSVPSAKDLSPGKLFFVGDEKQSIYRFRDADVSVFRKLKDELGNMELPLRTNYRSEPRLIGIFNTIFGGHEFDPEGNKTSPAGYPAVFLRDSPAMPAFEAAYTPLRADKKTGGKLTLCILDKQDEPDELDGESGDEKRENLSGVENEARYVAEKIKALLGEKNEAGEQKYRPNDIAILFRRRSPQRHFEKHLMLLNVPYASEDINGFFYGGPVNDLMSVLRLAAYPTDRAAYAQMLRSPFVGLSVRGLTACLAVVDEENVSLPFADEPIRHLSDDDKERYRNGQRVYQKILDLACRQSVSSLVSELWYGEGYRYETEWNPQVAAFREMYEYLFYMAVQADEDDGSGPKGLAAFTDRIQSLAKSGERLSETEIPLERQGAVQLMTIHKSKGLEFPVVFLCCCDSGSRNDTSGEVFETEHGLTLNPPLPLECKDVREVRHNYFWDRSLAVEKEKRIAELRRLLYVAMTRAEKELYLSGCLDVSKNRGVDLGEGGAGEDPEESDGDFSVRLKQYIEARIQKAVEKNGDKDDSIIEGDTFFGLCLPALGAHIGKDPALFAVEKIPAHTERHIRAAENLGSRFSNDQKGLNGFFEIAEPYYAGADVLQTPVVNKKLFSPTALSLNPAFGFAETEAAPGEMPPSGEYSGDDASDIFDDVDMRLDRYAKKHGEDSEKFNQGSFGTIAHICVQANLDDKEAVIPPKLAGFLNVADAEAFLEAGEKLALRFIGSPLGAVARKSENRKSEFPFRSLARVDGNDFFINGVIDLVFDDAETVHVVDFKTDGREAPELHLTQMACYYRAASDIFAAPLKKNCRVWLYYLRSGHAVEVTERAKRHGLGCPKGQDLF